MQSHRNLSRWVAGALTVAILVAVVVISRLPFAPQLPQVEPSANAQPTKADLAAWPMFGGTPARNMVNLTAKNLVEKWSVEDGEFKNVLWSADLGSRAYGGPTVAGGLVFIGTNNEKPRDKKWTDAKGKPIDLGVLMAFNQADGKFVYQSVFPKIPAGQVKDWPKEGLCSTPTADGDNIYYTSNRCEVVCANMKTGAFVWKFDMIGELNVFPHNLTCCAPLIVGDDLYVITANGVDEGHINVPQPKAPSFLKMNKKTGKVLWQDNSPSIKLTEVTNAQSDFMKRLVNRGQLIQHGQWSNASYAVIGGQPQVIFPGGDGWIYAFTPDHKLIWKFDCNPKDSLYELGGKGTRSDFIATPAIYKDRVYIAVGQDPEHDLGVGHLWCIDMTKTGDVSPELVTDDSVFPPKTKPNPNSAAIWHYGGVVKADDKSRLKRNYYIGRSMSTCAIHDDLLYIAELAGLIHCLDANSGKVYWEHDTRSQTWSSPYYADGKVYFGNDGNEVWVFAHGKEKKILAKNDTFEGPVRATPVAVGNVLYIIGGNKLYAIAKKD
jgi:outer membrane protein assembly factor BamB